MAVAAGHPLAAMVDQATTTAVLCLCKDVLDHDGTAVRPLRLPALLHASVDDALGLTLRYQCLLAQRAARDLERQEADRRPANAPPLPARAAASQQAPIWQVEPGEAAVADGGALPADYGSTAHARQARTAEMGVVPPVHAGERY